MKMKVDIYALNFLSGGKQIPGRTQVNIQGTLLEMGKFKVKRTKEYQKQYELTGMLGKTGEIELDWDTDVINTDMYGDFVFPKETAQEILDQVNDEGLYKAVVEFYVPKLHRISIRLFRFSYMDICPHCFKPGTVIPHLELLEGKVDVAFPPNTCDATPKSN